MDKLIGRKKYLIFEEVSILDVANLCNLHVKKSGLNTYTTEEHDSLVLDVKNNTFFWNSTGKHGRVIKFAQEFSPYTTEEEVIEFLLPLTSFNNYQNKDNKPKTIAKTQKGETVKEEKKRISNSTER